MPGIRDKDQFTGNRRILKHFFPVADRDHTVLPAVNHEKRHFDVSDPLRIRETIARKSAERQNHLKRRSKRSLQNQSSNGIFFRKITRRPASDGKTDHDNLSARNSLFLS